MINHCLEKKKEKTKQKTKKNIQRSLLTEIKVNVINIFRPTQTLFSKHNRGVKAIHNTVYSVNLDHYQVLVQT